MQFAILRKVFLGDGIWGSMGDRMGDGIPLGRGDGIEMVCLVPVTRRKKEVRKRGCFSGSKKNYYFCH